MTTDALSYKSPIHAAEYGETDAVKRAMEHALWQWFVDHPDVALADVPVMTLAVLRSSVVLVTASPPRRSSDD
jgi:hypothetical protein